MGLSKHITPLMIQCFVSAGVTLNMAGIGLVMGFSTVLLPQLKMPDSVIQIDDSSGSWIASIPGIAIIVGNLIVPVLMNKFGRKTNIFSIAITIIGWVCLIFSNSTALMIAARFFQGISMGIIVTLGPILIGEYTSPKNRGVFLMSISVSISAGVFLIHALGIYLHWQITSLICSSIAVIDMLIVILSPESPSWLAYQGKYDKCRTVFRYLRGVNEEEELERMIAASVIARKGNVITTRSETVAVKINKVVCYCKKTLRERAFYMPVFIMLHVYTMAQWSGVNIYASYQIDLVEHVVGTEMDTAMIVLSTDVQRIITSILGLILIKKLQRKILIFATVGTNFIVYLVIAVYTLSMRYNWLPYHNPYIGLVLLHIHMFSIATGALPMSFILSGEIYPLEYKGVSGGISNFFMSVNIFTNVKTIPILFSALGFSETYLLYSIILGYCLVIVGIFLPETKDRTLQDIEDEFRRKKSSLPQ
ncbi:LOW QUALITY PROTEIN: facilitated trehalose transporter Tret1-like [Aphomia sociella]